MSSDLGDIIGAPWSRAEYARRVESVVLRYERMLRLFDRPIPELTVRLLLEHPGALRESTALDRKEIESRLESAPWELMRWLAPDVAVDGLDGRLPNGAKLAVDAEGRPVVLFPTEWAIRYFQKQHPDVALSDVPFAGGSPVQVSRQSGDA